MWLGNLGGPWDLCLPTPGKPWDLISAYSWEALMSVLLVGACPLMREAMALSQACGAVYGVMWEAAWHDQRKNCGGTTVLSHKALADLCHMSNGTVIKAIDLLLDDGLIQFLHLVPTRQGSHKRRYRVTHPDHLEAQRAALEVLGPASERAKAASQYRYVDYEGSDLQWDCASVVGAC